MILNRCCPSASSTSSKTFLPRHIYQLTQRPYPHIGTLARKNYCRTRFIQDHFLFHFLNLSICTCLVRGLSSFHAIQNELVLKLGLHRKEIGFLHNTIKSVYSAVIEPIRYKLCISRDRLLLAVERRLRA